MSRQFLLDGYNVLKKIPALAEKPLEEGRAGLIRFIQNERPHGSLRNSIVVVFDGRSDIYSLESPMDVQVIFTKGETADDFIKRFIEDHAAPKDVILVSDDRELQYYARALGAEVWTVKTFVSQGRKISEERTFAKRRQKTDEKNVSKVFEDKVNKELENLWIKKKQGPASNSG